ncbi:hypothetical protein [Pseudogracilibacillus sp. ICA-222130]|uniref:hypothetical protein n=1 Tax=Pseudogracilibacillus sp. ICA-222130 TaxID=3134655 RepID=UPI0030C4C693
MRTLTILELEEKFSHVQVHTNNMRIFSLLVSDAKNTMLETKQFILNWLKENGQFPMYIYMSAYDDGMNVTNDLKRKSIDVKERTTDIQAMFKIKLTEKSHIEAVIGEYFCMSSHSELMIIATPSVEITMSDTMHIASATIPEGEFIIIIEHDGQGLQLLTSKQEWFSKEGLEQTILKLKDYTYTINYYGLTK